VKEFTAIRKGGFEFPVEISFSALQIKGEWFAIGIVRDITVRKQMQESLNDALDTAQAASEAKSSFLAAMSHDIRTPMNAIIGMADALAETMLTPEQGKYVDVFKGAGENLLALINDILDLSKIEAGKLKLEPVNFDINKLILETELTFQAIAYSRELTLDSHVAANIPPILVGDATRLRQILFNLTSNAIKFTHHGGISIKVMPPNRQDEQDMLLFAVSDSGIGVSEEKQESIFAPFSQADRSTTRKYGGSGLGLTICRNLVELMSGQIWVKSEEGSGSTFFFTVKLSGTNESGKLHALPHIDKPVGVSTQQNNNRRTAIRSLRILIVEDHEENLFILETFLKMEPHRLDVAENGKVAFEKIKANHYDLIFMDMMMPIMDGYEATRQIRVWEIAEHKQRTPIVALTANAMKEDIEETAAVGCDLHLSKPIRKARLLEVIGIFQTGEAVEAGKSPTTVPSPAVVHHESSSINREIFEELRKELGGVTNSILQKFLEKLPQHLLSIRKAFERNDAETLTKAAHKLKGSAATFGAERLSNICLELEEIGKAKGISADKTLLDLLDAEGGRVRVEVETIMRQL
jgi:signal transduction histidine kinase/DNA-binding response OmpR family regulator